MHSGNMACALCWRGRSHRLSSLDENADPFTNAFRVAVMTLRRKLGDPSVIETIPGARYRLERLLADLVGNAIGYNRSGAFVESR
jgi:hypothetical protein